MPRDIFLNWRNVVLSLGFEDLAKHAKLWTRDGEYEAIYADAVGACWVTTLMKNSIIHVCIEWC